MSLLSKGKNAKENVSPDQRKLIRILLLRKGNTLCERGQPECIQRLRLFIAHAKTCCKEGSRKR